MRIPHRWFSAIVLTLAFVLPGLADDGAVERMRKDLYFLAGPDCEGRGVKTEGIHKAAEYIVEQFQAAGVKPGGKDGSYFQPFKIRGGPQLGTPNSLVLSGPDGKKLELKYGDDFSPVGLSASAKAKADLVFVGYGITAKQPDYDDYADINVKGKWVVVLRQAPQATSDKPPYDINRGSPHPALSKKLENAVKNGAAGLIFVNHFSDGKDDDLMSFDYGTGPDQKVPVLHVKRKLLEEMLDSVGKNLADLEAEIDEKFEPRSVALEGWSASGEVTVVRPDIDAKNIIGVVEGAGPLADETVVIGAHYDHLGYGEVGSLLGRAGLGKVHYGADDNGSGTTGLIELARRFAADKNRNGRRLVFIAFSGEEIGLLGSRHYCKEPIFPLEKTAFMINMDMIGRSVVLPNGGLAATLGIAGTEAGEDGFVQTQRLVINGTGTAEGLEDVVDDATKGKNFDLRKRAGGTGPSDHDSFYRKRVPVLFLYTGTHRDYHRPTDTPDKIDYHGMARIVDLVQELTAELAGQEAKPKYLVVRENWADPTDDSPARPRMNFPKLGIMPGNYESEAGGVLVDDVSPGGAAEEGGVKPGDIIIEIAGKPVKNITGYMTVLGGQKAGEELEVKVMRKDKPVSLKLVPKP